MVRDTRALLITLNQWFCLLEVFGKVKEMCFMNVTGMGC